MANVASLRQPRRSADIATQRLQGIWNVVATFVSEMKLEHLTPAEIARILRMFDTANECIRIVLSDFGNDPAINQLVDQSREVREMIESVRQRLCSPQLARSA